MRRVIIPITFIYFCLIYGLVFANTHETHFRSAKWGMNRMQVRNLEKIKPAQEVESSLYYSGKLGSWSVYYGYKFLAGKLVEGTYIILEEHTNKNVYISDFQKLKSALQKKYGDPVEDEVIWFNNLYKSDPSGWGMAVSLGHLNYKSIWKTKTTEILLILGGDNFKITHAIRYRSVKDARKLEQEESAKIEKNL